MWFCVTDQESWVAAQWMCFPDVMFDLGYRAETESVANDWISMGARCLPGQVVFRVSCVVNVIPVVVSCIHELSSLESVWVRCAVARASNIIRFNVSCFNVKSLRTGNDRIYVRTAPMSHIVDYLGRDGLSSKVPLRKRVTRGCSPKVILSAGLITEDKADRAVMIAL